MELHSSLCGRAVKSLHDFSPDSHLLSIIIFIVSLLTYLWFARSIILAVLPLWKNIHLSMWKTVVLPFSWSSRWYSPKLFLVWRERWHITYTKRLVHRQWNPILPDYFGGSISLVHGQYPSLMSEGICRGDQGRGQCQDAVPICLSSTDLVWCSVEISFSCSAWLFFSEVWTV